MTWVSRARQGRSGSERRDLGLGHIPLSPLRAVFGRPARAPGRAGRPGRPQARPLHDDLVRAVREAVEGAVGEDGIVEEGDPLVDGPVARDSVESPVKLPVLGEAG